VLQPFPELPDDASNAKARNGRRTESRSRRVAAREQSRANNLWVARGFYGKLW